VGGDKSDAYEEYALYGGMPLVLSKKSDAEKGSYLQNLFAEVYFKDIAERYDIELPDVLGDLIDDLCYSVGSLTNANKIANTLQTVKGVKTSSTTVSNYLSFLLESFLFSNAKRYDVKGKKYFEYPSKYYCTDIGLRNARLNFRQQEETHIMENIIYNELVCRGYSVDVGVVDVIETKDGKKTKKQCEIDFVINKGTKKYYIQSALNVSESTKLETEVRPLKSTKDFFKKIIVSKSSMKPWTDEDGILHLGLYEFLLNEKSLEL
jgi:predicted AAA+ superfamily ATPase